MAVVIVLMMPKCDDVAVMPTRAMAETMAIMIATLIKGSVAISNLSIIALERFPVGTRPLVVWLLVITDEMILEAIEY